MRQAHTVARIRAAETDLMARSPAGSLMQRAAAGVAAVTLAHLGGGYGRRVALLVGGGDNGGDALYAGAMLARRGAQVTAVLLSDQPHPGGLAALRAAGGREASTWRGPVPDVVLDGIVGIGGRPGLRENAQAALAAVVGAPILAIDVPSGIDVDTGEVPADPRAHVHADLTVTFGTHRVAHLADPAAAACGQMHLVDLGLELPAPDVVALEAEDVAALVPVPTGEAHKYTRGVVGVRAGSDTYPGAALLAVAGAATGLAGMVRYVGTAAETVRAHFPEVVGAGRVQTWVVGPGAAAMAGVQVAEASADEVALVIDADALRHLPDLGGRPSVLTPHAGELAELLERPRRDIEAAPVRYARQAAARFDAVVLLKGRRTVIADPEGHVRINTTGTPWLATAGAGDVLAGLVGSLSAAGLRPFDAASVGAWLHGRAAEEASSGGPITAGRVAAAVPGTVAGLLRR